MNETKIRVSQPKDYKLIVEKDVKIPMRDGTLIFANIFRPDGGDERFPAIMNLGPYQKDRVWIPPEDLEEEGSEYMNWETANPLWGCPRGYGLCAWTRGAPANLRANRSPARTRRRSTLTT